MPIHQKVYTRRSNPGEGDCLFHSIAQALALLNRDKMNAKTVRKQTVKHLCKLKKYVFWNRLLSELGTLWKLQDYLAGKRMQSGNYSNLKKFQKLYRKRMGSDGEPGTVLELEAAAACYHFKAFYFEAYSSIPSKDIISFKTDPVSIGSTDRSENQPHVYFIHFLNIKKDLTVSGHWELLTASTCK